MKTELVMLLLRDPARTDYRPVQVAGYRFGKLTVCKLEGRWGVNSISGLHIDRQWFKTRRAAFAAASYLQPFADAALNDAGEILNWKSDATKAFQAALPTALELE